MDGFRRHAVYWVPEAGAFADWAASWLGWDVLSGRGVPLAGPAGLPRPQEELVAEPRKYGIHATLKPPFRVAEGVTGPALHAALEALAARLAPAEVPFLAVRDLDGFLALVPPEGDRTLGRVADACVRDLDALRAPLTEAELARRRRAPLTERQDRQLVDWGYPYVFEDFRFHVTLTGRLPADEAAAAAALLAPLAEPLLSRPFRLGALSLCGEDAEGRFHLIRRYALTG